RRLIPNAIEPRGVLAEPNAGTGQFTLFSSTQIPHVVRTAMALATGIPESRLRIVAPRVGGGFGSKLQVYAEEMLGLVLAKRLGRPVKWTETRSENYLATHHGRDQIQQMELAADEEGRIKGYRGQILVNMGAYLMIITPGTPLLGAFVYCGAYGGEAYHVEFTGVFTNTVPTDAYRGAGRPEATYAIERAIDALARKVGKDSIEIRRLNFLPSFTEPTPSPGGLSIDSGDYEATLDKALELFGYEDLRNEQQARRDRGDSIQLGIGFSTYLEMCGLAPSRVLKALNYAAGGWDAASIRISPTGKVVMAVGTTPHGQSHVTTFAQIAADDLGVPVDDVEVVYGDTELAPLGMDTYGSRSLSVGGIAVHRAAQKIVEKARKIAAHELEVSEDDLEYEGGTFSVKGAPDRAKTIPEIAFGAWTAHNLPDGMEP
ncbi:MAG TPA: molybdopterin cofactor-binding domain-containing protein, partial [Actinomycetota bacterium]|nr:molybdopterin cofactor-binding domain-containing protein [Actinomycetota bacterium]